MKIDYSGKKVAILGYGVNNAELVPLLQQRGARVTVLDKNTALERELPRVEHILGDDYLSRLGGFDIIFRTPGLPYLTPEIQAAKQNGAIITSQTQLFMEECPARVIGVTGTKGKGTTSSLIHHILCQAHMHGAMAGQTYLAGNIGVSPIGLLDKLTPDDWVVLELSSFQLQDMTISPHIAVVLTVTQDHLDHHKTLQEYHGAKSSIVRYQTPEDYVVVYADNPTTMSMLDLTHAQPYFYSGDHRVVAGCYVEESQVTMNIFGDIEEPVCFANDVKLVGKHNLENIAAATTASRLTGVSLDVIRKAIPTFEGLPHRLQFIAEKNGIKYYNDSFATQPDATMVAIKSFRQPITLILGGSSKGSDFTELVDAIKNSSVKSVVLIGDEGKKLKALLEEANVPQKLIDGTTTMSEILKQATKTADEGGIVLLSPACASFGLFKDYKDRGNQFVKSVGDL